MLSWVAIQFLLEKVTRTHHICYLDSIFEDVQSVYCVNMSYNTCSPYSCVNERYLFYMKP